ncbi:hypothetical protein HHK36_005600 [Tetracentron sinense]|uniref:Uncharacterized protein n=1 Tax=Tetracentron sinense TaxID=13715 RepID=A0A834ZQN0_TETSI|nr:hypothetical protein HHK36_005600 [Tetracentron sinense]
MEDSLNSMSKAPSSKRTTDSPEESGWTVYFEDFLSKNRDSGSCSSGLGSSSWVSDAASCAACKFSDHDHVFGYSSENSCKKLTLKNNRIREVLGDDALEDTASSPVNSPKVSDLKHLDMNPRKKYDNIDSSDQEKETMSGHYSEQQTDEKNKLAFNGNDSDCMELKKRGLCLVPLSMLLNYLG